MYINIGKKGLADGFDRERLRQGMTPKQGLNKAVALFIEWSAQHTDEEIRTANDIEWDARLERRAARQAKEEQRRIKVLKSYSDRIAALPADN